MKTKDEFFMTEDDEESLGLDTDSNEYGEQEWDGEEENENNEQEERICLNCGLKLTSEKGNFCSETCEHEYNDEEKEYSDYIDSLYSYCPICGEDYGSNPKKHKCNKLKLIENNKPRFYTLDLNNYNENFLKKIISWQNLKIRLLENPEKVGIQEIINLRR